jgi:hydrogenase maturation protease
VRVIGIGNALRGDDAAGLAVARRLRDHAGGAVEVRVSSGTCGDLLDAWAGASDVILVDSVRSGSEPGTIHRFEGDAPLPETPAALSSHAAGLAETVGLAHSLGRLPARLVVYGIEGARYTLGAGLSPEVRAAVETVCDRIMRQCSAQAPARTDRVRLSDGHLGAGPQPAEEPVEPERVVQHPGEQGQEGHEHRQRGIHRRISDPAEPEQQCEQRNRRHEQVVETS